MNLKRTTMRLLSPHLLAWGLGLEVASAYGHETLTTSPEVCKSKTINYITHTLPQQCLRTSWSSANSTNQSNTTNAAATATPTASGSGDAATETTASSSGSGTAQASIQPEAPSHQHGTEKKNEDPGGEQAQEGADDSEDLATSSFMSFEEWKAMMLQKSGQDLADLKGRKNHEGREGSEPGAHEGLDSWGDDGEIALDFDVLSGKISEMTATQSARTPSASSEAPGSEVHDPAAYDDGVAHYRRPKDAGKTCKERFSYSSFDGGATVLKTSPGAKNAKAILVENKDSYMLFTCSQENKFVIVELSEDILVDTVVLANFEFFSSMIRTFRISVSDKYPVKLEKWKDIGTFQARNSRDIQSFLIENPKIWAKYIRIEFVSHYGNEYYCPVSLLRVHGTRMLDSWKDAEAGLDDDEPAETIAGTEAVPQLEVPQENTTTPEPEATSTAEHDAAPNVTPDSIIYGTSPWFSRLYGAPEFETCGMSTPTTTGTSEALAHLYAANDSYQQANSASSTERTSSGTLAANATDPSTAGPSSTRGTSASADVSSDESVTTKAEVPTPNTVVAQQKTQPVQHSTRSFITPPRPPPGSRSDSSSPRSSAKQPTNTNHDKAGTGTTSNAAASPTVQESFFKSISKRLQFLESNTTLSLQYIEEQSKFLHQALQKMERRQISRVDAFLDKLNNTVLGELRSVRQQYDQIWQSTVLALETQREHSDREIIALSSRLNLLADEVVFQKRMAIFQSILLLCCLVLVLFSRGVLTGPANGSSGSFSAEQWPMAVSASTSQFFNTYLSSPRWPPGSPRTASRGDTPTPTHHRRPSASSLRHGSFGSGAGPLRPNGFQRAATGPGHPSVGMKPLTHSASYTDKMLPLTPTSAMFNRERSSESDDYGSPTPPSTVRHPPRIFVDEPDVDQDLEVDPSADLIYANGLSRQAQAQDYNNSRNSDGLVNGIGLRERNGGQDSRHDDDEDVQPYLDDAEVEDDSDEAEEEDSAGEEEEESSGGSASTSFRHAREVSPDENAPLVLTKSKDLDHHQDEDIPFYNEDEMDDQQQGGRDLTPGQDDVDGEEQGEHIQTARPPPLTRSPLSELGGNMRKPLPALPEDPS